MTARYALTAIACAFALAGCVAGPNYKSPEPDAPGQTPFVGATSPHVTSAAPVDQWWHLYESSVLDGYIQEALKANTDLRIAEANLRQARAVLRASRFARLPSTTIGASVDYGRESAAAQGKTVPNKTDTTYDAGIDASYQVDLFGQVTRAIQASRANAEAVEAGYALVRITVAAEVARAYADACSYGLQLDVANTSVKLQQDQYDLTSQQFDAGRGTAFDVARAGALLDQTRARIPTFQAAQRSALYRLAVLMGKAPSDYPKEAEACRTPPTITTPIPVGDGTSLLKRRPDVRQAERALAAATARIGVAVADLYPKVTLGASVGTTALSVSNLNNREALRFGIGPLISWSFPNIAVAEAEIQSAKASAAAALAAYEGTWLDALRDTESALANYANELDRTDALRSARDQSQEAAKLARARYDAGGISFLEVLQAESTLADNSLALAQSQSQLATDQIALFLALGGGWR